jgi:murein peptide amidase A
MKTLALGRSSHGLPLICHQFVGSGPEVLILGGVHGDEYEGVVCADSLLERFLTDYNFKLNTTIIPRFNPEGVLHKTRVNGRGVDLNRNLPTKDWSAHVAQPRYHPGTHAGSEIENTILIDLIKKLNPSLIVSLHSWHPMLNINGDCRKIAEKIAEYTNYKIETDIGYPTPGSLGTYAGLERNIPTLTYEIQRNSKELDIVNTHTPAICAGLKTLEK